MPSSLLVWTGDMLYEGVLFRQFACSICSRYYCVSYLLLLGGGGGVLAGSREGVPFSFLVVSPSGLPEWGNLIKLCLGSGCSGPCGCPVGFVRCSVSGSTMVLEGILLRRTGLSRHARG